jgi:hypothetical protein
MELLNNPREKAVYLKVVDPTDQGGLRAVSTSMRRVLRESVKKI